MTKVMKMDIAKVKVTAMMKERMSAIKRAMMKENLMFLPVIILRPPQTTAPIHLTNLALMLYL
nr:MAG TPA: hypothetical protein [Caudoviricetes sp.]